MCILITEMRLIGKLIIIIILLGVLLGASAYVLVYTEEENNTGNDTEPPQITDISGNMTVTAGRTATITVVFSDDVTKATLYYRTVDSENWISISILSGSADISTAAGSTSNYYYYVTVDDAAGNGPVGDPSTDGSTFYTIIVEPDDGTNGDDFTHTVFVEESTSVTCRYCPNVGAILEKLESSNEYRFYYVSMVLENSKAADYLTSVYNRYADPTVYIDGGYRVILGGLNPEADYTAAIRSAENRMVPKIQVNVAAEYKNATNSITAVVEVVNGESSAYSGRLRVYLVEIISSQFNDYNGLKYKNAFVDFVKNQDISVSAEASMTFSGDFAVGNLDYENLKLIAVVFNPTGVNAFSDPPTNEKSFTAYYADATDATYIVTGERNLPPEIGILSPQQGKIYLRGNLFLKILYKNTLLKNTWLLGKASIDTYAKDDSSITKVEFYVNDNLIATLTEPPYNLTLPFKLIKKPLIPKDYMIMVKAYDDTNKTSTASIVVKAWWAF